VTFGVEGLWVNLDEDDDEERTFIGSTAAGDPVFVAGSNGDDNEFFVARAKLKFKFGTF
jgi:outer membrane immunogenic protein